MYLLHAQAEGLPHWFEEIFLHGLLETLKLLPFLFLTYLLMEFIEHKAGDRAEQFMKRAGIFAPTVGGLLGAVPQCGFSAAAANLYAGRVVSMGTVIAVFLSTSDEMLPILISGRVAVGSVALILAYKAVVGIIVGTAVDLVIRLLRGGSDSINIDAICDEDNCHCERGIWYSALHHTLTISAFVLAVTIMLNALVYFIGEENLGQIMYDKPLVSHLIAAVFGLIPNCAASVVLTKLCTEGLITVGTMIAGLCSGAGVGILVLFRVNKKIKENLIVVGVVVLAGLIFGMLADVAFPYIAI